jgi:hypothetical protein
VCTLRERGEAVLWVYWFCVGLMTMRADARS